MLFGLVYVLKGVLISLCVALGVGFYTLLERKVLRYIQIRKGPNKVGFVGLPQPLSDALKLFVKEISEVGLSSKFFYIFSPVSAVFLMLFLWVLYMSEYGVLYFKLGVLFFLCVSRLNVYTVLLAG